MKQNKINDVYFSVILEQSDASQYMLETLKQMYDEKSKITQVDIINLLEIAVNDEMLATYNYMASYTLSKTEGKTDFDPEFKDHESDEYGHLHDLLERLHELGSPTLLQMPLCEIFNKNSAGKMWKQETSNNSETLLINRYNEEVEAVEFYGFILKCLHRMKQQGDEFDSTTEMLIKKIKADEEEHAKDLKDLLIERNIKFDKVME